MNFEDFKRSLQTKRFIIFNFMEIIRSNFENTLIGFLALLLLFTSLEAAPQRTGQYYQDSNGIAIREIRDSLENLKHVVNNHEIEIHIYDEKLKNFENIIEGVHDQLNEDSRQFKELIKGNNASLESKIQTLDTVSKGLINDLRQFKTHSNEITTILTQYQQRLSDLEKNINQQNQNIEHLQAAMRSLMEAIQGKPLASALSDRSYKVKPGDSLEKIARANQTTIQAIKEANRLEGDKIVVGKTLIIPEK